MKIGCLEGQNGVIDTEISGKGIGFDNVFYSSGSGSDFLVKF